MSRAVLGPEEEEEEEEEEELWLSTVLHDPLYTLYTLPPPTMITHTHTHTQTPCGQESDAARRRGKPRQSKIGLPQIVLSFCIISVSERQDRATRLQKRSMTQRGKKQNCSRRDGGGCRVSGWRPGEEIARRK